MIKIKRTSSMSWGGEISTCGECCSGSFYQLHSMLLLSWSIKWWCVCKDLIRACPTLIKLNSPNDAPVHLRHTTVPTLSTTITDATAPDLGCPLISHLWRQAQVLSLTKLDLPSMKTHSSHSKLPPRQRAHLWISKVPWVLGYLWEDKKCFAVTGDKIFQLIRGCFSAPWCRLSDWHLQCKMDFALPAPQQH